MPRTPRGVIDDLNGYTYLGLDGPTNPEDDYYEMSTPAGVVTIWGVGLVTIGPVTEAERDWIANVSTNSDLSTFPGDWISLGFSTPVQQGPTIEIWYPGAWIGRYVVNDQHQIEYLGHLLVDKQGIFGADSWSIEGLTSAASGLDFYWSDIHVTNGTDASETLVGTAGPETLNGFGGDDTLIGGDGADALYGGAGNDHLIGGPGIDRLFGGDGNDRLEPGVEQISQSFISMHPATDSMIDGGPGFDTLVLDYSGNTSVVVSADQLLSSPGITNIEAVEITGTDFTDVISGSSSADKLFGGGGFDVLRGGGGDDWLDAGPPGPSSVSAIGPGGNSIATAVSLDHLFTAGAGAPSVTLPITEPAAIITEVWGIQQHTPKIYSFTVAQAGAEGSIDWSLGPWGTGGGPSFGFTITDENGVQVPWNPDDPKPSAVFPHAGTYYLQVLFQTTAWDETTLTVTFSLEGAHVLTSNMLYGGPGDDTYVVYSPSDQVIEDPGEGTDTVRSSASFTLPDNVENLTLIGSSAINGTGNGDANVIVGNSGANVITGGGGADRLTGGGGADIFSFTALSDSGPGSPDLITDFVGKGKLVKGAGDKIDLSAIDANTNTPGDDAFKFVPKFNGHAGQLTTSYDQQADLTHIYLDVNGDGVADMTINLTGEVRLSPADFLL